jgi:hypothetical protein
MRNADDNFGICLPLLRRAVELPLVIVDDDPAKAVSGGQPACQRT